MFIYEVKINTAVYFTGRVAAGGKTVTDFNVWARINDQDIEITNTLNELQLERAKQYLLNCYNAEIEEKRHEIAEIGAEMAASCEF